MAAAALLLPAGMPGARGADGTTSTIMTNGTNVTSSASAASGTPDDARPVEDAHKYKLDAKPANELPTIFLEGDSTVRVGTKGERGWGDELAPFFDTTKVNVVNHAIGGRSSRTFQTEGRWKASLAMIQRGDYVIFQFGHNDGGAINDNSRARATLPGVGEETQEIDNMLTKQHEVVHTYGWYMRQYVRDTKAKGATPIICSLIPRKTWVNGKIARAATSYGGWARQVAKEEGALFVDLNEIVAEGYDKMGPAAVDPLFGDPHTHTSVAGAQYNARCVVAGLKGLPGAPLDKYLSAAGAGVETYHDGGH
jgi:lysophospholipase L1-like esterase